MLSGKVSDAFATCTSRLLGRIPENGRGLPFGLGAGDTFGKPSAPATVPIGSGTTGTEPFGARPEGSCTPGGRLAPTPPMPGPVGVGVGDALLAIVIDADAAGGAVASVDFPLAVSLTSLPGEADVGTVARACSSSAWPLFSAPTVQVIPLADGQTENRGVRAFPADALIFTVTPLAFPPAGQTQIA